MSQLQVVAIGGVDAVLACYHPLIALKQQRLRFGIFLLPGQAGAEQALGAERLPIIRTFLPIELQGLVRFCTFDGSTHC